MVTQVNKIQVSDSLGTLVDAVNALVETLQTSEQVVGNLDNLKTADSSSVVNAVNSVVTDLKATLGDDEYFEGNTAEQRFKELESGIGILSQYDYLRDTNLLEIVDGLLVLLEDENGNPTSLTDRLAHLETLISQRSRERIVSAEDFGIVSSSTLDQTEKVLELFNHASASGANVIYFPPGIFRFRPIRVQMSNMIVKGAGRKTIFRQSNNTNRPLLTFSGTVERAVTAGVVNWGDSVIPSSAFSANLNAGDHVRIIGKVSLSTLTDPALTGELTVGDEEQAPIVNNYYSEFNQVMSTDIQAGKLNLRSGVNSNTLSQTAPDVVRYNFRSGVVIKDLSFEQVGTIDRFLELDAVNDFIVDSVFVRGSRNSTQISINNSLNVTINNTTVEYVEPSSGSKAILINSSENCTVSGGAVRNAGMGICIQSNGRAETVANSPTGLISRSNTVSNVEIVNSLVAGIHEVSTHDTAITNCQIRGSNGQGIHVTGRRFRVEGNTIQTSRMGELTEVGEDDPYVKVDEVGINVFGAGAQDGIIIGNTIEGSVNGVSETGPVFNPKNHSGLKIIGNSIVNCFRGIILQRPSQDTGVEGINNNFFNTTIMGNTFRAMSTPGQIPIFVNFYVNGFKIIGNSFFGNEIAYRCMWLAGNFDYASVIGNSAIGFTETNHIYIGRRTGSEAANLIIDGNIGNFNVAGMIGRISRDYSRKNMSLIPSNDNWFDLGLSGARWRDVYLRNSPSVTSDRDQKEEIEQETLGLKFLNKLEPVSYKLKDGQSGRRHHGLIAQDVESALKQLGLTSKEHGGLVVDEEDNYSLRYEELIGSLILGVQELNNKIEKLEGNSK